MSTSIGFRWIAFVACFVLAVLLTSTSSGSSDAARMIYQFPNGTWVENIAVRPNGNLLVTLVNVPEIWEISPLSNAMEVPPRLLHRFDDAESMTGIAEIYPDVFAVVALPNFIWEVDFNGLSTVPAVRHLGRIQDAGTLDGMTPLEGAAGQVLITDSRLGLIYRFDTLTGAHEVVLQDDTMSANMDLGLLVGINGLKTYHGYLYYNNSPRRLLCRVGIDTSTGQATGSYETVSAGGLADDIILGRDGTCYLAGLEDNVVQRVLPNGTRETIAGSLNSTLVAGATAGAFGRTREDSSILYITTGGATTSPVNGTYVEGGKIVALNITALHR